MLHHRTPDALSAIRAQYSRLSEADQLSLLSDLLEGHRALDRSDDFIDAMQPVDAAFGDAYEALSGLQREPDAKRAGIFARRAA